MNMNTILFLIWLTEPFSKGEKKKTLKQIEHKHLHSSSMSSV